MSAPEDPSTEAARGAQVLLVDRDRRVREGFRKLLSGAGVIVTAVEEVPRALELATAKYFDVAVIDLDTPETDGGLDLIAQLHERSPQTAAVLLSARQTFDIASRGFRCGAADVVAKEPENVQYLLEAVVRLCARELAADELATALNETLQVLDQFLERLMVASRAAQEAEEMAAGGPPADEAECVVLLVDDNPRNGPGLQRALGHDSGISVVSTVTGGEALDFGSTKRFHVALVKNELPDLPAMMVLKGLRDQVRDAIVLRFTPPTDKPGRVDLIEASKEIEVLACLERGEQMVDCVRDLREGYQAKQRERRYLQTFRKQHYDFLKRYVELKQRLTDLASNHRRAKMPSG